MHWVEQSVEEEKGREVKRVESRSPGRSAEAGMLFLLDDAMGPELTSWTSPGNEP